jgi:hypothetical protein
MDSLIVLGSQSDLDGQSDRRWKHWGALVTFLGVWGLYTLTAAPGTIFGDPSEYQFIPAIWGIAHPPGYAFYTILAGVWQRIFQVGSVAFRTNLLAGAVGAWTVTRVFLIVCDFEELMEDYGPRQTALKNLTSPLLAALALAIAADFWQHSIHANAHIVSVGLTMTQLWLLVRWYRKTSAAEWGANCDPTRTNSQSSILNIQSSVLWLCAFTFVAGLGVTHHPITVFGFPAYAAFILMHRPRILAQPKMLLLLIGCGLLGLLPWLYFPLRSPNAPFGPIDMRTWEGFLRHATAQGLRGNLFHFGLADQFDRLRVFVTLLRLQYPWPLLLLIGVGMLILIKRRPRLAILWGLFLAGHLAFTLNSVQDVMAYLLHTFAALAVLLGIGMSFLTFRISQSSILKTQGSILELLLFALLVVSMMWTLPRISLHDWYTADNFVAGLGARFEGEGERAALVSDWEHLTPYFYHTYVKGCQIDEEDMRHVYVTSTQPWPESVFGNLPLGPVYLSNYRREIRELGFRLRPEPLPARYVSEAISPTEDGVEHLWRVLEPPATLPVTGLMTFEGAPGGAWVDGGLELLGYEVLLSEDGQRPSDAPCTFRVPQGGVLPLVLYARVATTQTDILMPYVRLGQPDSVGGLDGQSYIEQRWTTDSRRLTPTWRPGEIIAELYEVFIPYTLAPGRYALQLGYVNMTHGNRQLEFSTERSSLNAQFLMLSPQLDVIPGRYASREARVLSRALTNIGNDVALVSARARAGLTTRTNTASHAHWVKPLPVEPGDILHLTLRWQALARPRTSYTVFIHVLDAQGRLWMGYDYTPLGGAFPSYLWFPKWLEGQSVIDPYRLVIPAEIPPGQYWLEVGMYEMGSVRRIPQLSFDGTMIGDRFILGTVLVSP